MVVKRMLESAVTIKLNREFDEFQACVAIVRGHLDELSAHGDRLHSNEIRLMQTLKYDKRRTSYLLGRLSAKQAVVNLTGLASAQKIWIDSGVFEFPVVRCDSGLNIQVSICHCENIGLSIAFSEKHPMGIDLEKISVTNIDTISGQISAGERLLLKSLSIDDITGFTAVWSIKESLSKIIRTGMMADFGLFELSRIELESGTIKGTFCHFSQYKSLTHINKDYAVSVTLPKKTNVDLKNVWQMFDSISLDENWIPDFPGFH